MDYNPNGYAIGPGDMTLLNAYCLHAATEEIYFAAATGEKVSIVGTADPGAFCFSYFNGGSWASWLVGKWPDRPPVTPDFDPNPCGYSIGDGARAALAEYGLIALSPEAFFKRDDGRMVSVVRTSRPDIIVVTFFEPDKLSPWSTFVCGRWQVSENI